MKCDWCKKPIEESKSVCTAAGAFHGDCLDKLHATTEAFGKLLFATMKLQRPGGKKMLTQALKEGAGPLSDYFKKLAESIRDREREKGKDA